MPATKKPSRIQGQVHGIEKVSPGLKSSSEPKRNSSAPDSIQSGLFAEKRVIEYFRKLGYRLLAHRKQLRTCELDLIFLKKPGHALIVEVKTQKSNQYISTAISTKQHIRLQRAFCELAPRWKSLSICLAIVSHKGEIQIIDDIFG